MNEKKCLKARAQLINYDFKQGNLFMIFVLDKHNSIGNEFLRELRDKHIQQDRMRFRKNMERLGEIMAYEISKSFSYDSRNVVSPLGNITINAVTDHLVLITILRAGLAYFHGFVNFFDKADCGFIGAYREEGADHIKIKLSYVATQSLADKVVVLIDPMLATGRSVIDSVNAVIKNGKPKHIHIVSLVAAPEGLQYIEQNLSLPYSVWTCSVDEKLDENFYIVPGLGDAGDLSYGVKL
jgi:uracil phosphoribosyltransferase